MSQHVSGPDQSKATEIFRKGYSHVFVEGAVKVILGKAGNPGQVLQGKTFVQVGVDIGQGPEDPFLMIKTPLNWRSPATDTVAAVLSNSKLPMYPSSLRLAD